MPRPSAEALLSKANDALQRLGYRSIEPALPELRCRRVFSAQRSGRRELLLIQCRSSVASASRRYLVGIIRKALPEVDDLVVFLDEENQLVKVPAARLIQIYNENEATAKYSGPHDGQWRVVIDLDDKTLSPQGSNGKRYEFTKYFVDLRPTGSTPRSSGQVKRTSRSS